MDWSIVISRQKAALLAVVGRMLAMAGGVPTLAILRLLRPAESAARRLIVIVAAGLKERVRNSVEGSAKPNRPLPDFSGFTKTQSPRPPAFRLFDTPWVMVPRAFGSGRKAVPRISIFGGNGGAAPSSPRRGEVLSEAKRRGGLFASTAPSPGPVGPPSPRWGEDAASTGCAIGQGANGGAAPLSPLAGEMSAQQTVGGALALTLPPSVAFGDISPARGESGALHRRIAALHHALNTLPAQARRLKRIMAAREKSVAEKAAQGLPPGSAKNPLPLGPMRPGRPPGHISKPRNEADLILKDCQDLALYRTRVPP